LVGTKINDMSGAVADFILGGGLSKNGGNAKDD
jgi:hypothetical protein